MKVLLSGYYGFGNLGDEALLAGLIGGLQARGHQVGVLSGDPAATRALHDVPAFHRTRGLLRALLRHQALISGGGGLLQDTTSSRSLGYYLAVLALARRLGRRTLVYGQSIGPLSDAGRRRVARALRSLPVAVRDRASQQLLADLGVPAERVADPALLLEPPSRRPQATGPAGAVLFIPRGGQRRFTEAMIEAATQLAQQGKRLAALAFHPEQDAAEVTALIAAVPSVERWQAADPASALERIGEADYVVSVRLHGLILAAVAARPFCGLVYDPKVAAFLDEAGAPALVPGSGGAALLDTICRASSASGDAISALRARAATGLDWLDRQLIRLEPAASPR